MVHVHNCPLRKTLGRGKPTTEFYIDDKPQIYCYGWYDCMTELPLEECKNCLDFVYGQQIEIDIEERKKRKE